jgi:hypothetical protein
MQIFSLGLLLFAPWQSCDTRNSEAIELESYLPQFKVEYSTENVFEGYILLRKVDAPGVQFMIDNKAQIVWSLGTDSMLSREFTAYSESYISLENDRSLQEVSYQGDTLVNLTSEDFDFAMPLHHEVIKDSKGNFVALTKEISIYDYSHLGFDRQDSLVTDGVVVFNRSGKKLWHWSFKTVLDTMLSVPRDFFQVRNDWVHANAICEDDDDYVISFRDLNEVWKISSSTGEVVWRYGGEGPKGSPGMFKSQHSVHKLGKDQYMVFNNGPFKDSVISSGAVKFGLVNDKIKNTQIVRLPDSVFTLKEGSVYEFSPNRFLFSISRTGELIVSDGSGKVLWRAKSDNGFYRAYYVPKSALQNRFFWRFR